MELGSISRASRDLNIAQTALGLQVRSLEDSLGVALLVRHANGVTTTDQGRLMHKQAVAILGAVDAMVEEVRGKPKVARRDIRVGLAPNLNQAIGLRAVVAQADRLTAIRLHFSEGVRSDLLAAVQSGELDWAITHDAEEVPDCRTTPILRQSVMLICRPGSLLPPGPVALRDVLAHELVIDSGKRVVSGVLMKAAQAINMKPRIKFAVEPITTIKQLILNEGVFGMMNQAIVRDEIDRGELEAHMIVEPPLDMTAYFVTRTRFAPTASDWKALEFIDSLIDEFCAENPVGEVRLGRLMSMLEVSAAK